MTPLAALVAAASLLVCAGDDWIPAPVNGTCWATDVDFADARHGLASCAFSTVMATSDGGASWTTLATGLQQSLVFAHAASESDWFVAREGLYRSTDAGASWAEVGHLSGNPADVQDAHFDGTRIVAVQGANLRLSEDGGATWQLRFAAQSDVYLSMLRFPAPQTGYAIGGISTEVLDVGSVVRTQDGGRSWTLLSFPYGHITAADFVDAQHGAVATITSKIYRTADAGGSWQLVGSVPDGAYVAALALRDATRWYAGALSGCLYETDTGGAQWTATYCDPQGRELSAISLRKGGAVAVGNNGLALYENRIFRAGFD